MLFIMRRAIGLHVQGHLCSNLRHRLHQEVCGAHPGLDGAEGMLDRLAQLRRMLVEPTLHCFRKGDIGTPGTYECTPQSSGTQFATLLNKRALGALKESARGECTCEWPAGRAVGFECAGTGVFGKTSPSSPRCPLVV
jgi:hypothetical protein